MMDYRRALEILNLQDGYSEKELQDNYKGLAKKYHPDNRATGDGEKFVEVKEAFDFLSDPDHIKREASDSNAEMSDNICPRCKGRGKINDKIRGSRGMMIVKVECPSCNGSGKVRSE